MICPTHFGRKNIKRKANKRQVSFFSTVPFKEIHAAPMWRRDAFRHHLIIRIDAQLDHKRGEPSYAPHFSEKRMKTQATPKMMVLHAPVGVRSIVSFLVAFFIVASSIVFLFDRGQEAQVQMAVEHGRQEPWVGGTTEAGDTSKEECNWSRGQWVYDNVSRPLYSGLKCTFIFPEVACDKYGRKDVMYQHWRWQPHGCDLPR
jgi:hypothetical protein